MEDMVVTKAVSQAGVVWEMALDGTRVRCKAMGVMANNRVMEAMGSSKATGSRDTTSLGTSRDMANNLMARSVISKAGVVNNKAGEDNLNNKAMVMDSSRDMVMVSNNLLLVVMEGSNSGVSKMVQMVMPLVVMVVMVVLLLRTKVMGRVMDNKTVLGERHHLGKLLQLEELEEVLAELAAITLTSDELIFHRDSHTIMGLAFVYMICCLFFYLWSGPPIFLKPGKILT